MSTEPALGCDVAPLGLAGSRGWVNLVGVSIPGHTWIVVVVEHMWDGRREGERGGKDVDKGYALTKQTDARQSPTTLHAQDSWPGFYKYVPQLLRLSADQVRNLESRSSQLANLDCNPGPVWQDA